MIKINKLSYRYDNSDVLRNISLSIAEGDYLAVIGANGSGKTTLIKHLNSLLLPTKGDVIVDDINTKKDSWEIRKKVGMVFQNPEDQLVSSIVEEDVAFGRKRAYLRFSWLNALCPAFLMPLLPLFLSHLKEHLNFPFQKQHPPQQ